MTTKIEQRTISASLRALTKSWEIGGTAVAYGCLSQDLGGFRERIARGAFTRALASNPDVKCLFNHDQNIVLGRTTSGSLTLQDDDDGLRFLCRLNPDSQQHRDLHASIKRGDISECSFAFAVDGPDGEQFDDAEDEDSERSLGKRKKFVRRTVKRAKLFDVSCVTNPAYNVGTSVAARSANYVLRSSPSTNLAAHDAAMRAKLNRQATEINLAAPGLRVPAGTDRVVPMTLEECRNIEGWGKDEIFLTDPDVRAQYRALVLGAQIKRDQARQELREFLADITE